MGDTPLSRVLHAGVAASTSSTLESPIWPHSRRRRWEPEELRIHRKIHRIIDLLRMVRDWKSPARKRSPLQQGVLGNGWTPFSMAVSSFRAVCMGVSKRKNDCNECRRKEWASKGQCGCCRGASSRGFAASTTSFPSAAPPVP